MSVFVCEEGYCRKEYFWIHLNSIKCQTFTFASSSYVKATESAKFSRQLPYMNCAYAMFTLQTMCAYFLYLELL
jgi:hypothetical protein